MRELPYTMTDNTITVVNGGKNHLVRRGSPNFMTLREALLDRDWDSAIERLTVAKAITNWAKGRFKVQGESILFDGVPLPNLLNRRILSMAEKGEDPTPVCLFVERLQKNPSSRSVEQLFPFLNQLGIPLTKEGKFLAYKAVTEDFLDIHSQTIDNTPGRVVKIERNKISDDPREACHFGLHVGALEYASTFGGSDRRVVIVEVDPADVVCVPYDASQQKMRVCQYKVVGMHNGQFLSNTSNDSEMPDDLDGEDQPEVGSLPQKNIKVPQKYRNVNALDSVELLDCTMELLRDYATNGLKIVGASKIPGGKIALIKAIDNVRRNS